MYIFNPFPHNVFICYSIVKILILRKEGIMGKISYERRAYQSVYLDDGAYLRLYLKNWREKGLGLKWVNLLKIHTLIYSLRSILFLDAHEQNISTKAIPSSNKFTFDIGN